MPKIDQVKDQLALERTESPYPFILQAFDLQEMAKTQASLSSS
jgi:hypothetical protein